MVIMILMLIKMENDGDDINADGSNDEVDYNADYG